VKITITYTGQLAEAAGASTEELELEPGATLGGLVDELAKNHGAKFASLLRDDSNRLRSSLLVALDGTQATGDREALALDEVRELMFMTPIAGG